MTAQYRYRIQCQPEGFRSVDRYVTIFVGEPLPGQVKALRGAWMTATSKRNADLEAAKLQERAQDFCYRGDPDGFLDELSQHVGWP